MSESFKVVLLDTNNNSGDYTPIELGYLQAYLEKKAKLSTHVLNAGRYTLNNEEIPKIAKYVLRRNPSVIGISAMDHYLEEAFAISKAIRERDRDVFIVMGGYGPTFQPERCLRKGSCDLVVRGEGELTAAEVFPKIVAGKYDAIYDAKGISYEKDDKIISNENREPIMKLDELPFPERRDLSPDKYTLKLNGTEFRQSPFVSSRGCHWSKCEFCIGAKFPGTETYRLRSIGNIMAELKEVNDKYGLGIIQDYSACFLGKDTNRTKHFFEESKRNFSGTYFGGQIRPEDLVRSREVLSEHVEQLYGLAIGVENFSNSWLKRNNKGVTSRTNQKAIGIAQELSEKRSREGAVLPEFYIPMTIDCDMETTFREFKEHYETIKKIGMINRWVPGYLTYYPYIDEKQQKQIWLTANHETQLLKATVQRVADNPYFAIVPSWAEKDKVEERGRKLTAYFDQAVSSYRPLAMA